MQSTDWEAPVANITKKKEKKLCHEIVFVSSAYSLKELY
jgi:hypothetical protein